MAAGDIDIIATDHVHRDISVKSGGIWKVSPGCAGLETLLSVLLTDGHHERCYARGEATRAELNVRVLNGVTVASRDAVLRYVP